MSLAAGFFETAKVFFMPITSTASSTTVEDDSASSEIRSSSDTSPTSDASLSVAGMESGVKDLYAGADDKRGRYEWVTEKPKGLGEPAENEETAKWALIVRHIRVYNDPKKVLQVHSIVVQSPLLKALLGKVLKGYPDINTNLDRLTFSGSFEPLFHRFTELRAAISEEKDAKTKEHGEVLLGVLEKELKANYEEYLDLKRNHVVSFDLLFAFFQPRAILYTRNNGQDNAVRCSRTRYGQDGLNGSAFYITCEYVDWDGAKYGFGDLILKIPSFAGTVPVTRLPVFPLDLHRTADQVKQVLEMRGKLFEALAGAYYKAYNGVAWRHLPDYSKDRRNVKGRVVIDTASWNRFNPNHAVFIRSFPQSELTEKVHTTKFPQDSLDHSDSEYSWDSDEDSNVQDFNDGMPYNGAFPDEAAFGDSPFAIARRPLSSEQLLLCTPMVRGYSLSTKTWFNFFVNSVREIEWNTAAFSSLVLPSNSKELILGFTETQRKLKDTFDDVIEGKGRGIILLLCGPPGVGKTLTAESVAEEMRVPLYSMSAGDLGFTHVEVERNLTDIMEMCAKWSAILLIDEADVFLEQRSLHELERNKLVSIFLRTLEYYEGIMVLTTNRVNTLDPAFSSRIHVSLEYADLTTESRATIWQNFLKGIEGNVISGAELQKLARLELNGRQVKNVVKMASLLAGRKGESLSFGHVRVVLEVTQHLHNKTQETDAQRSALYG